MHKFFCRILRFFNLVDRGCNLSITNIAVIVLITKMGMASEIDWPTAAGLMVALLNYAHKRTESNKVEAPTVLDEKIAEVKKIADQVIEVAKKVT